MTKSKDEGYRIKARLELRTGELVGFAHVPPFMVLPEVIQYGSRVFILDKESSVAMAPEDNKNKPGYQALGQKQLRYYEDTVYHVTELKSK